jgi:cyanate permease
VRSRSPLILLTLLWLIGIALRLAILAVPPVIPTLRDEFNLSGTEIGILSGVPIVVFGVAALVGSRLVAWIGVVAAVVRSFGLTIKTIRIVFNEEKGWHGRTETYGLDDHLPLIERVAVWAAGYISSLKNPSR